MRYFCFKYPFSHLLHGRPALNIPSLPSYGPSYASDPPGQPIPPPPGFPPHPQDFGPLSDPGQLMDVDNNCNQMLLGQPGMTPPNITMKTEPYSTDPVNTVQQMSNMNVGPPKELCAGCRRPIEDRFLLRVLDNSWHESCLQCSVCQEPLTRSCFVKDGKLLCKGDYDKIYGARCHGCMQPIPPNELVMRAVGQIYHLRCFACVACGHQLQKGEQFVVKDGHLYCRMDYEKEFTLLTMSPKPGEWCPGYSPKCKGYGHGELVNDLYADDDSSLDDNCDLDAPKGPKRPRTILTTSQRRKFKASFEINPKPCRKVRETLAAETGLSVRVVQVWFQNQRAKMKKIARRQTSDGQASDKDGKAGKNQKNKKKREDDDDSSTNSNENIQGQTIDENQNVQSSPQSTNLPLPPQNIAPTSPLHSSHPQFDNQLTPFNNPSTNSQDLYSSGVSDSLYGSSLGIDSSLDTLGDMLMSQPNGPTGPTGHGPVANPIDKLYSMQSSYFSTD